MSTVHVSSITQLKQVSTYHGVCSYLNHANYNFRACDSLIVFLTNSLGKLLEDSLLLNIITAQFYEICPEISTVCAFSASRGKESGKKAKGKVSPNRNVVNWKAHQAGAYLRFL